MMGSHLVLLDLRSRRFEKSGAMGMAGCMLVMDLGKCTTTEGLWGRKGAAAGAEGP